MAIDISGLTMALGELEQNNNKSGGFLKIPLAEIDVDINQPRKSINEDSLIELSDSIKERGVLQPIIVTPKGKDGKHKIIMGERRFRASQLAGKKDIPAIIREETADAFDQMIENIQREELSVFDIATLIDDQIKTGKKARDIGKTLGKSESWVSKYRAVLKYHVVIQEKIGIAFELQTAIPLQKAIDADETQTLEFIKSLDSISRSQAQSFLDNLLNPKAVQIEPDISEIFSNSDLEDETQETIKPKEVQGSSEENFSGSDEEKEKAPKKPKYGVFVELKKPAGKLGRIMTDRISTKEGNFLVFVDDDILDLASKDVKLIGVGEID